MFTMENMELVWGAGIRLIRQENLLRASHLLQLALDGFSMG
jgi:hypothetical protein